MTRQVRWAALLAVALGSFFGGGWLLRRGLMVTARQEAPAPELPPVVGSRLFQDVLRHVRSHAVDSLDEAAIYRLAAAGMLEELDDPYAALLSGPDRGAAKRPALGIYLDQLEGRVVVVAVRPGSPAEAAGVRAGDLLLEVGRVRVDHLRAEEVAALLEAGGDEETSLLVARPGGRRLRIPVPRTRVPDLPLPTLVRSDDGIAHLKVTSLVPGTVERVARLLDSARGGEARGLILDLRGVVEGELDQAVALAGLFLGPNALVVSRRDRRTSDSIMTRTILAGPHLDVPMVVLVDRGTSGPAEVVAGALQDNDRALLVGEPTFGRGGELSFYPLSGGLNLRLTTALWITPSGRLIQRGARADESEDDAGGTGSPPRPQFRTVAGRVVFGGGGVVPDREVPAPDGEAGGDPAASLARQLLGRARTTRTLLALDPR